MPATWRRFGRFIAVGAVTVAFGVQIARADDGSNGMPNFTMVLNAPGLPEPFSYNPADFQDEQQFGQVQYGTYALGGPAGDRIRTGWRYQGGLPGIDQIWNMTWDCVVNPDPFVDATMTFTNTSATTQTFDIYMLMPLSMTFTSTVMSGSVAASITNNDAFTTTAVVSDAGVPIYQAFIDPTPPGNPLASSAVKTLWDPPKSIVVPTFQASGGDSASFLNQPGPAANSSIAIRLHFNLSPGDTVLITGIFEIVPGPGGLAAFALFGAFGLRRRRRS